jgi:hypothetical protein
MPPSVSTSQQQASGIARAVQKGEIPASKLGPAAKSMAKMPSQTLEHFARTPYIGLPKHVKPSK